MGDDFRKPIKIVFTSDLHGFGAEVLPKLSGDILVIAGDLVAHGNYDEYVEFNKLLGELDFKEIVVIAGNHDKWLSKNSKEKANALLSNAHYLLDSSVILYGIKFYGSPYTPPFMNWYFMENEEALFQRWAKIPEDTDILITHCPPYGVLDKTPNGSSVGSHALRFQIQNKKPYTMRGAKNPIIHVFGHIHHSYGTDFLVGERGVFCINASVCDEDYRPVNKPFIINY